jgi:hypothetical protein
MQGSTLIVWNTRGFFVPTRRAAWRSTYRNEKPDRRLVTLVLGGLALFLAGLSGRTLPELTGIGSGRSVALAGAKAFYTIDYQDGPDVWAARLCAVSTQPACEFYQSVVAPFCGWNSKTTTARSWLRPGRHPCSQRKLPAP